VIAAVLRRVLVAFVVWLVANSVAGLVFYVVSTTFWGFEYWRLFVEGLLAGVVFGVAQWLALRPFFADVRFWAPVTVVASPVSWMLGILYGMATLGLGGWIGAAFSAAAQTLLLAWSARHDERLLLFSLLWFPAALVGGALFYFGYYFALLTVQPSSGVIAAQPSPIQYVLGGSVAFAVMTGLVVALLVAVAARRSAPGIPAARSAA
jgi:hypothetical protein